MGLYKDVFQLSDDQIDELYQCLTEYYPHKSESDKYIDIATWGHFRSSHARLSAAQSQHSPTWEYLFEWSSPVDPEKGSCHAIELPFVFLYKDDEIFGENPPITLIEQVQNAWISFARNGDPNHSDLPVWPQYNKKDKRMGFCNGFLMWKMIRMGFCGISGKRLWVKSDRHIIKPTRGK